MQNLNYFKHLNWNSFDNGLQRKFFFQRFICSFIDFDSLSFRLGAHIPSAKSQASSESTKMKVDDVEDEDEPASSSTKTEEPPKVESDPESELGS